MWVSDFGVEVETLTAGASHMALCLHKIINHPSPEYYAHNRPLYNLNAVVVAQKAPAPRHLSGVPCPTQLT